MTESNDKKSNKNTPEVTAPEVVQEETKTAPPVVDSIDITSGAPPAIKLPKNVSLNMRVRQMYVIDGLNLSSTSPTAPTHGLSETSRLRVKNALDNGVLVSGKTPTPHLPKAEGVLETYLKRADEARSIEHGLSKLVSDVIQENNRGNYTAYEVINAIQQQELKRTDVRPAFLEYLSKVMQSIPGATIVQDYAVPQSRPVDDLSMFASQSPEAVQEAIDKI